jgi:hypothetical protein
MGYGGYGGTTIPYGPWYWTLLYQADLSRPKPTAA